MSLYDQMNRDEWDNFRRQVAGDLAEATARARATGSVIDSMNYLVTMEDGSVVTVPFSAVSEAIEGMDAK